MRGAAATAPQRDGLRRKIVLEDGAKGTPRRRPRLQELCDLLVPGNEKERRRRARVEKVACVLRAPHGEQSMRRRARIAEGPVARRWDGVVSGRSAQYDQAVASAAAVPGTTAAVAVRARTKRAAAGRQRTAPRHGELRGLRASMAPPTSSARAWIALSDSRLWKVCVSFAFFREATCARKDRKASPSASSAQSKAAREAHHQAPEEALLRVDAPASPGGAARPVVRSMHRLRAAESRAAGGAPDAALWPAELSRRVRDQRVEGVVQE